MGILQYRTDLDTNKIITSKMIFGMRLASLNFDIRDIGETLPKWQTSIFNYVSNNLLREKGYTDTMDEGLNVPYLVGLLSQSIEIFKAGLTEYDCSYAENLHYMHDFFEGFVNHPDGSKSTIYIVKHDDNGYILMLPSDYERYFNQTAILPPLSLHDIDHRTEKINEINKS